jgi:hypothetical protein
MDFALAPNKNDRIEPIGPGNAGRASPFGLGDMNTHVSEQECADGGGACSLRSAKHCVHHGV